MPPEEAAKKIATAGERGPAEGRMRCGHYRRGGRELQRQQPPRSCRGGISCRPQRPLQGERPAEGSAIQRRGERATKTTTGRSCRGGIGRPHESYKDNNLPATTEAAKKIAPWEGGDESYKDNNLLAVVGAASHAARRGRQENSGRDGAAAEEGEDRPAEGRMRCGHYRRGATKTTTSPQL